MGAPLPDFVPGTSDPEALLAGWHALLMQLEPAAQAWAARLGALPADERFVDATGVPTLVQIEEVHPGIAGAYDERRSVAFISPRLGADRARRGLIHELLHAADAAFRFGLTHDQVRQVATFVAALMRDPFFAKFVNATNSRGA